MVIKKFDGKLNVVGSKISQIRQSKEWSYTDLATKLQLLGLNMHRQQIYNIEHNKRAIRDWELFCFAKALGVKIDDFYDDIRDKLD